MSNAVPVGWRQYRIADVLRQEKVKFEMNDDESYPLLSVRRRNGGFFHRETLKGRQILTKTLTKAIPESFVISKMQVVHGACGVIEEPFYDGYLSASYVSFLSKDNRVHIPYFNYLCHTPLMYRLFLLSSHGVHIEKMTFDVNDWLKKKVVLPPFPEQQKVAAILSSVDEVIEKTRAQIDKLKDLKTGMMQELLTKGIGSDGVPHTEFKDSPVGRIPASWDVQLLRDVCERVCVGFVGTCERHYRASGVPMIRTGNLKDGKLDLTGVRHVTDEFHKKEKKSQLKAGDLLIARHGSHGSACLVPESLGEANCLNVVIVRPSQTLAMPLFLKYVFNSGAMKASFGAKSEGSTQSVISTTEIAKTAFPIPPIAEQRQISSALSTIDGRIEFVERKLTNSLALKKALMQDLLTGKVRVKVDQKESADA